MAYGAAKSEKLEQKRFSRENDAQSLATGDRRLIQIELCQCDIRRSRSLNQ